MVRTKQNFEPFDIKMVNHFVQSIDAILDNVFVADKKVGDKLLI